MIRAALILLALATPAQAASLVDRLHCWAYPHHERCRPPTPPAEPVQPPPAAPVVAPVPPPQAVPTRPDAPPRAVPLAKAKPRAKPKFKVAPRKRAGLPSWCARIPKGTTMGQIEFAAPGFGVKLTPANRRAAQACLASK